MGMWGFQLPPSTMNGKILVLGPSPRPLIGWDGLGRVWSGVHGPTEGQPDPSRRQRCAQEQTVAAHEDMSMWQEQGARPLTAPSLAHAHLHVTSTQRLTEAPGGQLTKEVKT